MLPYHWDDREKLAADYRYLASLNAQLLRELVSTLNELHGTQHSVRYWQLLIGPWLGYFTAMLFDRWLSVTQAIRDGDVTESIVLVGHEEDLIPFDMPHFSRLFLDDPWNHFVYASILRDTGLSLVERAAQRPALVVPQSSVAQRGVKPTLKRLAARLSSVAARDRGVFMMNTYLPMRREAMLHARFRQAPQYWATAPTPAVPVSWARRDWNLNVESHAGFERWVRSMIPRQIPTSYLEGYTQLVHATEQVGWPESPRLIWTSNAHYTDEVFKAWAAERVERGVPLVVGQHGGHFGIGRLNFLEDHDAAVCDRYLSWGWVERDRPITPIGQLKARQPLGVDHATQPHAVLVTCEVPRYSYWLYSVTIAGQYLEYLEDQYAFLDGLPPRIRRQMIVRLYPSAWSGVWWSQAARMMSRVPDVRFDKAGAPIDDTLRESRLYISTYNATTFLESFTMNIPTVIFWDPRYWELRDSALPYFDDLRRAGVFHDTPKSAADHVAAIWDDVAAWWTRPDVTAAVRRFVERYADVPNDLIGRVERALRDTMRDAGRESAYSGSVA